MGDLKVGDYVYGADGKPTKITMATEVMHDHDCYEVEFDNGEIITADEEHLWTIGSSDWGKNKKTLTTKQILDYLPSKLPDRPIYIEVANPLEKEEKTLPIGPYTLGVWLGDGYSISGRYISEKNDNTHVRSKIINEGYELADPYIKDNCEIQTIYGLQTTLKECGIFNNKRIPKEYFDASIEQRLELLRGLMDTDGYCNKRTGSCEFYQKSLPLINDVRELICSLGMKVRISSKIINEERYYTLRFSGTRHEVFSLERKLNRQDFCLNHPKNHRHYIKQISKTNSVPVRCIQVDNEDHLFLCGKTMIPTHNSTTMISYLLHYVLFNQSMSVAVLANKQSVARDILGRLQLAYEYLPLWLQQGIVAWNKGSIELENGSKILASSTSASAIRGGSYNCISGKSTIIIRDSISGEVFDVSIEEFYANSSRNNENYTYLHENDKQQIQELVLFSDEESTRSSIRERSSHRKSSYNSKVPWGDEREEQHSLLNDSGTLVGAQTASEILGKYRQSQNGTRILSYGSGTTRRNGYSFQQTTNYFDGTILRSEKGYANRNQTHRRNKKENQCRTQRQEAIRRSQKEAVCCNERKTKGNKEVGRFLQKGVRWSNWEEENQRAYRQDQQEPREDSQNSRETSWNETLRGIQEKNERVCKSTDQETRRCLEQRNEAGRWEVYTSRGWRKFHGVSKTHNQKTIRIETEAGSITCTPDHKISTIDGFVEAKEISYGSKILSSAGSFVGVLSIEDSGNCDVYDLIHVDETHSFFANGLEVHNCILLDEFAHVSSTIADEFFNSVYPTITSGSDTKVIMISTPNGLNMFYYYWKGATKKPGEPGKNDYIPFEVHWSQIPGRDEEWKAGIIKNTSQQQFDQEMECSFLGSQNTLINSSKLKILNWAEPEDKNADGLWIYEKPKEDRQYYMTVDTARGQGKDYSAFLVFDTTELPYKIVAKYRNNTVSPMVYPTVISTVAKNYNNAHILVEINDIGGQVADILHQDLEYENVMMTVYKGRAGQTINGGFGSGKSQSQLGVRTTGPVKKLGCSVLKSLIEEDKMLIEDVDIVNELVSFIAKRNSFEADDGHTDDLVMCLVLFAWMTRQEYFKSITETDVRTGIYKEEIEKMEENMIPFGFVVDGSEDEDGDWDGEDRWFAF
jgi:hypothetical protein